MELKLAIIAQTNKMGILLIVPYGIETMYKYIQHQQEKTFNRTLWN